MANELKVQITGDASSAMAVLDQFTAKIFSSVDEATGSFGKLAMGIGGVAGVASAMAGKVMEGLKEVASFAPEASEQVNKLARTFEGLALQMGEGLHNLNVFDATMKMTGGSVEELADWLKGVTKAMESNSAVFLANGIAASQNALMQMEPIEVMRKSLEVIESEEDQTRKLMLARQLLGRAGIAEIPQMHRFFETLGEGEDALKKYGAEIDQSGIDRMKRMEKEAGALTIQMDALKRGVSESYEPWDKFFAMMNRGLLHIADFALKAVNGIGPLINAILHPIDAISSAMADEQAGIAGNDPEMQREQMRASGHAIKGTHGKTKEDLKSEEDARKQAAAEAKKAAEVLLSLKEEGARLGMEDLKTADASTIALKKKRDEAEALAKLNEDYAKVAKELGKANTPETRAAADQANLAAWKLYQDKLVQITRDSNAAQLLLDAANKAALEAAQKKALEDLKKDIAERSLIQGKLSRDETDQILNAYAGKGANEAGAVKKYKLEVHWDEPGSAGALAGLKAFVAKADNAWGVWKTFTTQMLSGLENGFDKLFTSMTQHGLTMAQRVKGFFSDIGTSGIQALSKLLAQQTTNWIAEKAIAAWKTMENAREGAMLTGKTAAQVAAAAEQEAINAGVTASDATQGAAQAAIAETTMAAKIYAWYAALGPWAIPAAAATIAGVILAIGAIGKVTAHATGGLINSPTLALMGEAGPEVVAPQSDFRDWAGANQNLGFNLGAHAAQVSRLQGQAGSYGAQGLAQSGGTMPSSHILDMRGAIFAGSLDGQRAVADMVDKANQHIGRTRG